MFDVSRLQRDDVLIALGTAVAIGAGSFVTSSRDDLAATLVFAVSMAALAFFVSVLFGALE